MKLYLYTLNNDNPIKKYVGDFIEHPNLYMSSLPKNQAVISKMDSTIPKVLIDRVIRKKNMEYSMYSFETDQAKIKKKFLEKVNNDIKESEKTFKEQQVFARRALNTLKKGGFAYES